MQIVRWGIVGCGDVAEIKSGPGFQKAEGSALVSVMRRDRGKAEDFARRHGVPRVHGTADALIDDPDVDAVYVATPPSTHCELALKVAAAGKPCLVEKPMAINHRECVQMLEAFGSAGLPLWVAYYRRALPRFLKVRELLTNGTIGEVTSVHVNVHGRLAIGERARAWRFDPAIAGGGLFLDMGCHCFDLLDFLIAPVSTVEGIAINTGRAYLAEDVAAAVFKVGPDVIGSGIFNFNAAGTSDVMVFAGTKGELRTPIFTDGDVVVAREEEQYICPIRNPPHVHQPLIQTIVNEMLGNGQCPSTGETGARTSWVMDRCLSGYYRKAPCEKEG
jgi:1,5-anhydro-D-fructose reductase (1,5-anhydro-D-mannitol-forming)